MKQILLAIILGLSFGAFAQVDSIPPDEPIDFSQFENAEVDKSVKRYCTAKVLGLSPNKLISVGYDFQGAQTISNTENFGANPAKKQEAKVNSVSGLRLSANVPVVSNTRWLVTVGANYWRMNYDIQSSNTVNQNYFLNNINQRGLTTIGLNSTVFKPLNEKNFIMVFGSADANGDYNLNDAKAVDYLTAPKYTVAAFWGWKRNDRSMLAVGISRTYRPGAQGYIPLVLYNHTFENRKWGIEALFPARAALRRTFNSRNLLFVGYELEGNSYSMINRTAGANPFYNDLELRRSEIRPRITWERQIKGFLWFSAQVGYRINYSYDVDQGDDLRLLGSDAAFHMTNTLSNTWYAMFSINLVSP
jgi:hypothetical protein